MSLHVSVTQYKCIHVYMINLKVRERKTLHLLTHSPDVPSTPVRAGLKLGARNSIQVSRVGDRKLSRRLLFPGLHWQEVGEERELGSAQALCCEHRQPEEHCGGHARCLLRTRTRTDMLFTLFLKVNTRIFLRMICFMLTLPLPVPGSTALTPPPPRRCPLRGQ